MEQKQKLCFTIENREVKEADFLTLKCLDSFIINHYTVNPGISVGIKFLLFLTPMNLPVTSQLKGTIYKTQ